MEKTARELALLALYQIEYESAYANLAVKDTLSKQPALSGADKAFFTSLVYGAVRYRASLDYVISCYSKVKLKKLSKYILLILRLGIYQLSYMDKIPDSAAVNESVKLAKKYGHPKSAGFVNGILHSVIRGRDTFSYPKDPVLRLSVQYSYPEWMVKRFVSLFGEAFSEELMAASNQEPDMSLRVNTLKTSREEVLKKLPDAEPSKICPEGILSPGFDLAHSELFQKGWVTAQDAGAMLAARVLNPKPGDTVYDLCAAPGGKTTHLAQLMENRGKILAFDLHPHKIDLIEENAERLGVSIISAACIDASQRRESLFDTADCVLADVPCSGLGIIQKKPDIKWKRSEADDFSEIQYRILENAGRCLKKGGVLVYSTCTIEPKENEEIIQRFLEEYSEFQTVDFSALVPFPKGENGMMTLYPNIEGTDGFFIAKLMKV